MRNNLARMNNNKINLQRYSMHFGTLMGVYWIIKFALFPLGLTRSFLLLLFLVLTIAVPFIGYRYARLVRDKVYGGVMTFSQAFLFLIFMYMFASLLTAVGHYIYFNFIDNGYILNTYSALLESVVFNDASTAGFDNYVNAVKEMLELAGSMTPIETTMQLLSSNMLNCSILSLITALFVMKKKEVSA